MRTRTILFAAVAALAAGAAQAQTPVMDGSLDASIYGAALSIQNTNTQFGNAGNGDPINAGGGSEIDQIFATVVGTRLYVFVAGNLETNFNKLEVFIDSEAGGVNVVDGVSGPIAGAGPNLLPGGVDPFCCGGIGNPNNRGALQRMDGLTFDTGFNADHYLTITHGFENALDDDGAGTNESPLGFYAASAHYADLTDGAAGRNGALGMQLAQRGLPNVLRGTTADIDIDGDADGNDFLIYQRNVGATAVNRLSGDSSGNGSVGNEDLDIIKAAYGFQNTTATFGTNHFAPQSQGIDDSDVLLGPTLPGLTQGDLIDKVYAFGAGGATDNAGTGAITRELEFVLPLIDAANVASHRNMENIVDLQLAIDNSNTAGVNGDAPYTTPTAGNPSAVTTGIEFSIPLSEIGTFGGGGAIKIFAFINGGGHDYASNQFSGTGILDANLGQNGFGGNAPDGGLPGVNMLDYAGDQFVTVANPVLVAAGAVPEPGALVLAGFAAAGWGVSRRRRLA